MAVVEPVVQTKETAKLVAGGIGAAVLVAVADIEAAAVLAAASYLAVEEVASCPVAGEAASCLAVVAEHTLEQIEQQRSQRGQKAAAALEVAFGARVHPWYANDTEVPVEQEAAVVAAAVVEAQVIGFLVAVGIVGSKAVVVVVEVAASFPTTASFQVAEEAASFQVVAEAWWSKLARIALQTNQEPALRHHHHPKKHSCLPCSPTARTPARLAAAAAAAETCPCQVVEALAECHCRSCSYHVRV